MKLALRIAVAAIVAGASLRAERPLPVNESGWIRVSSDFLPEKNSPLMARILSSLAPWGESVRLKSASAKWIPESYAIGVSGKFEFYSFIEP